MSRVRSDPTCSYLKALVTGAMTYDVTSQPMTTVQDVTMAPPVSRCYSFVSHRRHFLNFYSLCVSGQGHTQSEEGSQGRESKPTQGLRLPRSHTFPGMPPSN